MYNVIYDPYDNIAYDINSIKGINLLTEYLNSYEAYCDHSNKNISKKKRKKKNLILNRNKGITELDIFIKKIKFLIGKEEETKNFIEKLNDTLYNTENTLINIKKYMDNSN